MPPKPFTLDSVLTFRKRQENMAQEKHIQAKIAAEMALQALDATRQDLEQLIRTQEEKQKTGILVLELARFEERIQYGRNQLQLLKNTLKEKQKIAAQRRKKLLEKAKEHKALNTLKEQQNKAWKNYLDKKEAAMLDEIAILHHDREIN
jgi:flagellar protein FliJ